MGSYSKQNPYIQIFRDAQYSIDNVLKTNQFNCGPILIDDPTYLGFKIEFGCFGASMMDDGLLKNMFQMNNDVFSETILNDVLYNDYDNYPMGLLNPNEEGNGPKYGVYSFTNTQSYSALNYLYNRNDDRRYEQLKVFQQILYSIQRDHPYVFTKINGISNLFKYSTSRGSRLKDAQITIDCLESLDLRIKTLMNLYRNIAWDDAYQRWILPDIMRQFKMLIYVADMRQFQFSTVDNVDDDSVEIPMFLLECAPCEFILPHDILEDGYQSTFHSNQPNTKLQIKVKNVRIYERNEILGKFTNLYIADIFNSRFRNDPEDEISTEMIAKEWMQRTFFLGTQKDENYDINPEFTYRVHKWLYGNQRLRNYLFYSGAGLPQSGGSFAFLDKLFKDLFGYDSGPKTDDLGKPAMDYNTDVYRLISTMRTALREYSLHPGQELEDLYRLLNTLMLELKNNKIYYNNIIKDTNNDRSLATDLDGKPDTSGIKNLDTTPPSLPKNNMVNLKGKPDKYKLNDPKLFPEIPIDKKVDKLNLEGPKKTEKIQKITLTGDNKAEMIDVKLTSTKIIKNIKPIELSGNKPEPFRNVELVETGYNNDLIPVGLFDNKATDPLADPGLDTPHQPGTIKDSGLTGGYDVKFIKTVIEDAELEKVLLEQKLEVPEVPDGWLESKIEPSDEHYDINEVEITETQYDNKLQNIEMVSVDIDVSLSEVKMETVNIDTEIKDGDLSYEKQNNEAKISDDISSVELSGTNINTKVEPVEITGTKEKYHITQDELSGVEIEKTINKIVIEDTPTDLDFTNVELAEGQEISDNINQQDLVAPEQEFTLDNVNYVNTETNIEFEDVKLVDLRTESAKMSEVELKEPKVDIKLVNQTLFGTKKTEKIKDDGLVEIKQNPVEIQETGLVEFTPKEKMKNIVLTEPKVEAKLEDVKLEDVKPTRHFEPVRLSEGEKNAIKLVSVYLSEPNKVETPEFINAIDDIIKEQMIIDTKLTEVAESMNMSKKELIEKFRQNNIKSEEDIDIEFKNVNMETVKDRSIATDLDGGPLLENLKSSNLIGTDYISTATGIRLGTITSGGLTYDEDDMKSIATDREIKVDENTMHQLEIRRQRSEEYKNRNN